MPVLDALRLWTSGASEPKVGMNVKRLWMYDGYRCMTIIGVGKGGMEYLVVGK